MNKNLYYRRWINIINREKKPFFSIPYYFYWGRLTKATGIVVEATGLNVPIGTTCFIECKKLKFNKLIECEVVGFKNNKIILITMDKYNNYVLGAKVYVLFSINGKIMNRLFPFGKEIIGKVLYGNGDILNENFSVNRKIYKPLYKSLINPVRKVPITEILDVGIKAINGLLTIGKGQRIGIFASSGVGKSMLINMIAQYTKADILIINLIGERTREIQDFISNISKRKNINRTIFIVSPAGSPSIIKINSAKYAASLAEYFRDKNNHVLVIMDSLTRYAIAQREIGLSMGELPISKGYPSSVFSNISDLLERMGNGINIQGSITAFYTVLIEEDDYNDPIVDSVKAILDGHIFLSKDLAESGHYPAIDIELSISRVLSSLVKSSQIEKVNHLRKLISIYKRNKDLIAIGAYQNGRDPLLDQAINLNPKIKYYLCQDISSKFSYNESIKHMLSILD